LKRHYIGLPHKSGGSAIVLADLQVPFQDKRAFELALKVAADMKPDFFIGLGDWADCFWWSRYKKQHGSLRPKGFPYHWNADGEKKAVQDTWALSRAACPNSRFIYLQGNHEERVRRIVQDLAPSTETKETDFEHAFQVRNWWDQTYPYEDALRIGHLWFTHGDVVRIHTAKCMFEKWGTSICFGHTHRWEFYSRRTKNGEHHGAFGIPCLCDLDAHYLAGPNWSHGFAVVHWVTSGLYNVTVVPVLPGYKCVYGGKLYTLRRR